MYDVSVPEVAQLFAAPVQSRESDERYTPRWVFEHLALTFETDPCSPGHGNGDAVPATRKITALEDGLAAEWTGLVWCNPPFSNSAAWARRFIRHGSGVFLGPFANSGWTQELLAVADLIWLCADFAFTHPTHAGKRSSMPLLFCSIGQTATDGLERLATTSGHNGTLVVRA